MNVSSVATIVGCSERVVKEAERGGKLKKLKSSTYEIDSVVSWLINNPRYIAQYACWEITEDLYILIQAIVKSNFKQMVNLNNNDAEEIVHMVVVVLAKKPKRPYTTPGQAITQILKDMWAKMKVRQIANIDSLDDLTSQGVQF